MRAHRATRAGAGLLASVALLAPAALPAPALADGTPVVSAAAAHAGTRLGDRVLAVGMRGTDVFHLQILLRRRGYHVASDHVFGPQTRAAVAAAQRAYGLAADGIAGPLTIAALRGGHVSRCSSAPGAGDYVSRWRDVVACVLGMLHEPQTAANIADVLLVVSHESGGDPSAVNRWDVNAKHGDPSRGLMQVIGSVFEAYRSRALADSPLDPAANIYAGIAYALARYGSIAGIPGVKAISAGRNYVPYKQAAPR